MTFPCELTIPEAVRISVSKRRFSAGARNGSAVLSSSVVAVRQPGLACAPAKGMTSIERRRTKESFIERTSFEMDEPALNSDGSRVCAVTDAKLAQQVIDMGFDRCLGDRKIGRDLLVRATRNNALEDCKFAGRKVLRAHALGEFFGDRRRDAGLTGVDQTDSAEQIINCHSLKQVGLCPSLQPAKDNFVPIVGCQDDKSCRLVP